MPRSDLDAPARVSHLSAATSPFGSRRRCVHLLLVFSFAFPGARQCRAQEQTEQRQDQIQSQTLDQNSSVRGAARQERARKQNQQKKASHVYTAEDLKREHILTPKDRGDLVWSLWVSSLAIEVKVLVPLERSQPDRSSSGGDS